MAVTGITGTIVSPRRSRGQQVQASAVTAPNRLGDVFVLGMAVAGAAG
jgi:hypothetical protein